MPTVNIGLRKPVSTSLVLWRGPSLLDDAPIMVIATKRDLNPKTGPMVQTWIIRDDVHPVEAGKTGQDSSVCGDCRHRGDPVSGRSRSCYVTLFRSPGVVFKAFHGNRYRVAAGLEEVAAFGAGKLVRLGSYGDPAAVPVEVWHALLSKAASWTGYTHQWRNPVAAPLRMLCMASADTREEVAEANAVGWRSFGIRTASQPVLPSEAICPASEEGGYRSTCAKCKLCAGASKKAKNIVIISHGAGRKSADKIALTV